MPKENGKRDVLDDLQDIEETEDLLEDEPEDEPEPEEEKPQPKKEEKKAAPKTVKPVLPAPKEPEPKETPKPKGDAPKAEEKPTTKGVGWGFILGVALLIGAVAGVYTWYKNRKKNGQASAQADAPLE